jgi:hypothetical protein
VTETVESVRANSQRPPAEYSRNVRGDRHSVELVRPDAIGPRRPPTQVPVDLPDDTVPDTFPAREPGTHGQVVVNVRASKSSAPPKEEKDFAEKVRRTWSPVLTLIATLLGGGGLVIGTSRPTDHGELIYQVMREELGKQEKRIQALESNALSNASWNLGVLKAQGVTVQQDMSTPEVADVRVAVKPSPAASVAGAVTRVPTARGTASAVVPASVDVLTPPPVPPAVVGSETDKLPVTLDALVKKRAQPAQGTPNNAVRP